MKDPEIQYLLVDGIYYPVTNEELGNLSPIIEDFVESFAQNQDKPIKDWLIEKLRIELPEKNIQEIEDVTNEIVTSINVFEYQKESLKNAIDQGRSKESWFARQVQDATSKMSSEKTVEYLQNLDNEVNRANEALARTIRTKSGDISQNPSLHGYIAEQEHVNSFNFKAVSTGSKYRAKIVGHNGEAYTKNGVDISVVDINSGNQRPVQNYQLKYDKDAASTSRAMQEYRNQQKVCPGDQIEDIRNIYENKGSKRKVIDHLEAPDGTCSEPLSYERSKQLQKEAQSGKWNDKNWNSYKTKDIAAGIGKQAGYAALMGAVVSAGTEVIRELKEGEKIEAKKVAQIAVTGGVDFGAKAAITGALKAGSEKNIIKFIPKGTPASSIANVVFVAAENTKILYRYGKGELNGHEALEKMEETTVSTAGGMIAMGYGAAKGAALGTLVGGPVGAAVGGFIGGTLAYMAGSEVGKFVVNARRKITSVAKNVVKSVVKTVGTVLTTVGTAVSAIGEGILSAFSLW